MNKLKDTVHYIARMLSDQHHISREKLTFLLYLIQGYNYKYFYTTLFTEDFKTRENSIYIELLENECDEIITNNTMMGNYLITNSNELNGYYDGLTKQDMMVINYVLSEFGSKTTTELREIIWEENSPAATTYKNTDKYNPFYDTKIHKETLRDHFMKLPD